MDKKLASRRIFFLLSICALLSGCGNNDFSLSQKDRAAFKDAAPEIKQEWEKGLQADKVNDYQAASTSFRALLSRQLTAEQLMAVQTALGGLNQRMNEAAAKGDAAAKQALDAAKAGGSRR